MLVLNAVNPANCGALLRWTAGGGWPHVCVYPAKREE